MDEEKHAQLPWLVRSDKYPSTVKRVLLVGRRDGDDYVIAAESMEVRHKDAKSDYAFICEAVNAYDSLRSQVSALGVERDRLREALTAMLSPPMILETDNPMDIAAWFVREITAALAATTEEK